MIPEDAGAAQTHAVVRTTLVEALGLPRRGALISIVGGGGKSALLFALGSQLPGRVVLTTTTRIFAAQIERAADFLTVDDPRLKSKLDNAAAGVLVIGSVEGEKALGVDPLLPARWVAREQIDHVVVEADGSRMRPVKAPAGHEPVIARGSTHVVIVVGIDALEGPIADVAHRPERVSALLGLPVDAALTPASLADLLCDRQGGLKGVAASMRAMVLINKVETPVQRELAEATAGALLREPRIDRVVHGALEGAEPDSWTRFERLAR